MSTFHLRKRLIDIARRDVGKTETSHNRGEWIKKYWPATTYKEGYTNREPYCAAGMCYDLREWLKDKEVRDALKMTAAQAEIWRCKSARAFDWLDWAERKGLHILDDNETLHTGDVAILKISHSCWIKDDDEAGTMFTVDKNSGATTGNDGDGCWEKVRKRSSARGIFRILE